MNYPIEFWDNISLPPTDHRLMDAWERYFDRCLKTGRSVKFSKQIAQLEQARINANAEEDIFLLENTWQSVDEFGRLEHEETYAECLTALTEDPALCQEVFLALSSKVEFENSCLSLQQCLLQDKALIERNSLSPRFNAKRFQSRIDFIDYWLPIVDSAVTEKINNILITIDYNLKDLPIYLKKNHWGHIQGCLLETQVEYLTGEKKYVDRKTKMSIDDIKIMFGLKEPPREIKRRRTQSQIQTLRDFIACSKDLSISDFECMFATLNMEYFDYSPILAYVPLNIKPLWEGMSIEEVKRMLARNEMRKEEIESIVARTKALIAEQGSCPGWDAIISAYENPKQIYPSGITGEQFLKIVVAQELQRRNWENYNTDFAPKPKPNGIDLMLANMLEISNRYTQTISYDEALKRIKEIILNRLENGILDKFLARGKDKRKRS